LLENSGLLTAKTPDERTGYGFGGWYKESVCANEWDFAADVAGIGTILYAQWLMPVFAELKDGDGNPVNAPATRVLFYRISDVIEVYEADREADGKYHASLPASNYIVSVENVPGHLTTYYADTHGITAWHDADTLALADEGANVTVTIHMAAIPAIPTGEVTIEGYVIYNGDNSGLKAKVARNATVGIYYSKKGAAADVNNPDDWTLVRTVQPNEDAYYIVRNLPAGTYMVVADIPGYEMTESYTMNATEGETYSDNNFFVDDETKTITVADEKPTWTPTSEREAFRLYPNPFNGTLHITGAEGCTLRVFTATGAAVHTRKVTGTDETIHLEHLPAGLYLFQLEKDGKTKTIKIVKNE
jgi:hypothetical protein